MPWRKMRIKSCCPRRITLNLLNHSFFSYVKMWFFPVGRIYNLVSIHSHKRNQEVAILPILLDSMRPLHLLSWCPSSKRAWKVWGLRAKTRHMQIVGRDRWDFEWEVLIGEKWCSKAGLRWKASAEQVMKEAFALCRETWYGPNSLVVPTDLFFFIKP